MNQDTVRAALLDGRTEYPDELMPVVTELIRLEKATRDAVATTPAGKSLVQSVIGLAPVQDDAPAQRVRQVLPDAPVPDDATIPDGWSIGPDGSVAKLTRTNQGARRVEASPCPIVVAGSVSDVDTGDVWIDVRWCWRKRWHSQLVPREALASAADTARILSPKGLQVNATNAKLVIQYLEAYQAANMNVTPRHKGSNHFGWQGKDGQQGYLVGGDHIATDPGRSPVRYSPTDKGDAHLEDCLATRGTITGWLEAMELVRPYPMIQFGLYASLAAPLLRLIPGARNFVVDYSGLTSSGKTTALAVAASAWGDPDDQSPTSLISSWDTTQVGIERRAANLTDLPLLIDDSKRAKSYGAKSVVPEIVYCLTNGQGKTRGSKTGQQALRSWRTVVLTSGEGRLVDFDQSAGTRGRVLTLWGNPFGGHAGDVPDRLKRALYEHHGHAAREWVEYLASRSSQYGAWAARHALAAATLGSVLTDGAEKGSASILGRLANYLATVHLAAELAQEALGLPWPGDAVAYVADHIQSESIANGDDCLHARALADIYSVALANRKRFFDVKSQLETEEPANGGWWGVWHDHAGEWEELCWYPPALREQIRKLGHDPRAILRHWADSGWLVSESGHNTVKRTGPASRPRVIAIKRSAINDVE